MKTKTKEDARVSVCIMFNVDERNETLYEYIHFVVGIQRAISITLKHCMNGKDSFLFEWSSSLALCSNFKYKVTIVTHRIPQFSS